MERKHWIDNLRWVTVLLVLFYHVFYFYNNKGVFGGIGGFGEYPECKQYQDIVMYVLYPWFMPLLFLLAGVSARYALQKQSAKEWFKARTRKLLVPGTIGLFVFHWMVGYFNTVVASSQGYFGEIDKIVEQTNQPRFLVYSATLESNLAHELERYIGPNIPVINEEVMTASSVSHYLVDIRHNDVLTSLIEVIEAIKPYLLLVFASKKETANELFIGLRAKKYKAALLTGDLDTRERKSIIRRVKDGEFYILVCSDMAARGLDIPDVTDVINVDLPNNLEFYYHRAGRTGRFNKAGNCYTFYNNDKTAKPLALIKNGVPFKYFVLRNGELVPGKSLEKSHPTKRKVDEELQNKIRKVKAQTRTKDKKVKPGYKKKQKEAIDKVKQQHRREIIRKDIRRQRVERYKRENRNG